MEMQSAGDDTTRSERVDLVNPTETVQGGERELVLGIEDKLTTSGGPRRIPREDVAELCVQCLGMPEAMNRYGPEPPATHSSGCACSPHDPSIITLLRFHPWAVTGRPDEGQGQTLKLTLSS